MDTIRNPTTGRLIKKTSVLGKKIAKGYIPPEKPCKIGNIKNPKTYRCVKESGSIGKKIKRETGLETKPSIPIALPLPTIPQMKNERVPKIIPPSMILAPPPPRSSNLPASVISQLDRLNKLQQIKEKNNASNIIQKVFRGRLARKKIPLNYVDAPDFPQPLSVQEVDAKLNRLMINKDLFDKPTSLPKSNIDILQGVQSINSLIKQVNKPRPKIKRTNKRNDYDNINKSTVEKFEKDIDDYIKIKQNNAATKIQSFYKKVKGKKIISSNNKLISINNSIDDFRKKLLVLLKTRIIAKSIGTAILNIIRIIETGNIESSYSELKEYLNLLLITL
jgi:hypothetical protein